MKVTLIAGKYFNSWEALGLGYIGAYLKRHCDVELNFFHPNFDSDHAILEGTAGTDICMFSCTSPAIDYALTLAGAIKCRDPKVRTVFGGYHPSALPGDVKQAGFVDYVVVGEGEVPAEAIVRGYPYWRLDGRRMSFDELSWPDRELIRNERHIAVAEKDTGLRITSFQSRRGCPYGCKYCLDGQKVMYKGKPCERDIKDLLTEIDSVAYKYRLDLIKFCDPTWNTNPQYVKDFCKEKIRWKLHIPFFANIHARNGDQEMFDMMAEANCTTIGLGVETGSERILQQMGKGTTKDDVRGTVRMAKNSGIGIRGYFLTGMPDDDNESLQETMDFADELELDEYGFTILCPYPGTAFYAEDPERFKDVNWEGADEYRNDFWRTKYLTNAELVAWQDRLMERFCKKLTGRNKTVGKGTGNEGSGDSPGATGCTPDSDGEGTGSPSARR